MRGGMLPLSRWGMLQAGAEEGRKCDEHALCCVLRAVMAASAAPQGCVSVWVQHCMHHALLLLAVGFWAVRALPQHSRRPCGFCGATTLEEA